VAGTLSPFPPIASYAFLSDSEVCALVAPTGNVEWMCLPRFDRPSIFGALLDRDAGLFKLDPRSGRRWGNFPQAFSQLALLPVPDIRPRGISWTR